MEFAKKYTDISAQDKNIILHSCMNVLSDSNCKEWIKKNDTNNFDVPMGSYMGAEICDLIGLFILSDLSSIDSLISLGLYRDDGLTVLNKSKCVIERTAKRIRNIFKNHGFKISVESNLIQTDFLDITMNLPNNTYAPFRKDNSHIKYINNQSNHPKLIRKSISPMIYNRLIKLSSSKTIFDNIKKDYNEALLTSGHNKLQNYDEFSQRTNKKNKRTRKIIYFNPPFCNSVKTKIGKKFLGLVQLHFPKNNRLHKIFNKNTIKISYSCLPNVKNIINSHNKKILDGTNKPDKTCNCRDKLSCPFNGECLLKGIYKATVMNKEYIGSTGVSFKTRWQQHKYSVLKKSQTTTLSKFAITNNTNFSEIKWQILYKINSSVPKKADNCSICNLERMAIAESDRTKSLNIRKELTAMCPHFRSCYF